MDLSKLSDSDLRLLADGNVKLMSVEGLRVLSSGTEQQPSPAMKVGRDGFADALASVVSEQNPITAAIAQGGNTAMQYVRGLRQMSGGGDTKEGKNQDLLKKELAAQFPVASAVGDVGAQIGLTYLGAKAIPAGLVASKAPILANPYVANTAVGAALGGLKYGDLGERASEAGLGAAGGAAGTLVGRAIPAAWNGVKGIVEPFTKAGQENIVGRTLNQFAVDPSRVVAAGGYASKVPGVMPTTAEAALDPGISNLQRQFAVGLSDQQLANNAARVAAMRTAGGDATAINAATSARETAVNDLYDTATNAVVSSDDVLSELLSRPASRKAMAKANEIASNKGEKIVFGQNEPSKEVASLIVDASGNPSITQVPASFQEMNGKGLHYLKLAIDDMLSSPATSGIGKNEASALMMLKNQLVGWIDGKIPEYGAARSTFADLSKPINSMELGNEILKKSSSAAEDALGNPTLRNEALSRVLRDGDSLAQNVTGFNKATLRSTLNPTAMDAVSAVRRDLARKVAAENLGRASGSPTAQNLASQNLMRQIAGPLGAPSGFAEANIWPTLLRPVNWAMKAQEPKIEGLLIEAMKDPKIAAALISRKSAQPRFTGLLGNFENYAIPGLTGGLLNERP